MASLYQRTFLVFILLIAFAGRVVIYAMPIEKLSNQVIKENGAEKSEKPESSEKENPLEEKVKLADLFIPSLSNFEFLKSSNSKRSSFTGIFDLTHCHLQIPEQPPK
ncbi:hypothetical protein EZ449_15195 [Pedobacter frigidisoli]|uniref:Uncharacterized protein n=1 Tax=Pedobacter frigidisoli TaxID=2530455 RepID=A0A4R0NZB2_9SPHI|nr:hypothetical protein [Pedobacter frigidisoli]TCD07133.1 hypothetical protein EZ449_15195 [Pedobacter frigidisoli]